MSSTLVRAKIVKGLGSGSVRRPGGFNPENTGCGMDKIAALNYQRGCLVNPVESIPSVCYSQEEELELKGGDSGDWTLVPEKDDLSKSESLRNTEPPTTRSEASEEGPETPGGCWARGPLRFFPSPKSHHPQPCSRAPPDTQGSEVKSLSRVRLFSTPWTVAHQAPPSMGFSRQQYWNGLPFHSPGDLPNPGIEPRSPALQADTL